MIVQLCIKQDAKVDQFITIAPSEEAGTFIQGMLAFYEKTRDAYVTAAEACITTPGRGRIRNVRDAILTAEKIDKLCDVLTEAVQAVTPVEPEQAA